MTNYRFTCHEGASLLHMELVDIKEAFRHCQRSHKWFTKADRFDKASLMLLAKQATDTAHLLLETEGSELFFDHHDVMDALLGVTEWVWAVEAGFYAEHYLTYEEADKKLYDAYRVFTSLTSSAAHLVRLYEQGMGPT